MLKYNIIGQVAVPPNLQLFEGSLGVTVVQIFTKNLWAIVSIIFSEDVFETLCKETNWCY
jgi:hypothetical protein